MGREAQVQKRRFCATCKTEVHRVTADELQVHVELCRWQQRTGLILPGILDRPQVQIHRVYDEG